MRTKIVRLFRTSANLEITKIVHHVIEFHLVVRFRLGEFVEFCGKSSNIIPCFHRVDTSDILLFIFRELNIQESTNLVVKVDTVNEAQLVQVVVLDTEEIIFKQFLITSEEVATDARKLILHLTLDTSIFENVEVRLDAHTTRVDLTVPTLGRSIESMTNFVTNQQVIQVNRHILPDREDQGAVLEIEHRSRNLLVFNTKVLSSEQLSKGRLRRNRHHKTSSINIIHSTRFCQKSQALFFNCSEQCAFHSSHHIGHNHC